MGCCESCLGLESRSSGKVEMPASVRSSRLFGGSPAAKKIKYNLDMRGAQVHIEQDNQGDYVISGKGVAVASLPLEQDSAYWEVKVLKEGTFAAGVARTLDGDGLEQSIANKDRSWGCEFHAPSAGVEPATPPRVTLKTGDVLGCVFAQSDMPVLRLYRNGEELQGCCVDRVRGLVYPALYVEGGMLSFTFHEDDWAHCPPSSRLQPIMESRDMI